MLLIAHQQGHTVNVTATVARTGKHTRPTRIDWVDVVQSLPPLVAILTEITRE